MQPYQEASEEHTRQSYRPFEAAGSLGVKGAIGGRIMSMLNKYIPANLAMKGLSKIEPRIGKFVSMAQEMGHSFGNIGTFISKNIGQEAVEEDVEQPQQSKNIVEQYSPELHSFISDHIKQGRNPYQAGAIASKDKRFGDAIKKLTKDHGLPWHDILTQIYGGDGVQKKQGMMQQEDARFQTGYGDQLAQQGQQQQGQQQGQGLDPSVQAILQQGAAILQSIGGGM